MQSQITIFTDGSSRGNPGPGGWGAIISDGQKVTELGGYEARTTNNRMELQAVLESLKFVIDEHLNKTPVVLHTDSSYVANGITSWIKGWQFRGWVNQAGETIANVDIWKDLSTVLKDVQLKIVNVSGHSGVAGNERTDVIATSFALQEAILLYHGAYAQYGVDLMNISIDPKQKKSKDRKKEKAFSYLSLVNGKLERHTTWDGCKQRVEGMKGAKYKKAISKEDEESIKRSWGL